MIKEIVALAITDFSQSGRTFNGRFFFTYDKISHSVHFNYSQVTGMISLLWIPLFLQKDGINFRVACYLKAFYLQHRVSLLTADNCYFDEEACNVAMLFNPDLESDLRHYI